MSLFLRAILRRTPWTSFNIGSEYLITRSCTAALYLGVLSSTSYYTPSSLISLYFISSFLMTRQGSKRNPVCSRNPWSTDRPSVSTLRDTLVNIISSSQRVRASLRATAAGLLTPCYVTSQPSQKLPRGLKCRFYPLAFGTEESFYARSISRSTNITGSVSRITAWLGNAMDQ